MTKDCPYKKVTWYRDKEMALISADRLKTSVFRCGHCKGWHLRSSPSSRSKATKR